MAPGFCADDVVAQRSPPFNLAVVDRTHQDVDTHIPYPGRTEVDKIKCDKDIPNSAFRQFMRDGIPPEGTVLVRWRHLLEAQLTLESKLEVVDRSFLIADIVRRDARDAMSGVVINTFTSCTLQPVCDITLQDNCHNSSMAQLKALPPQSKTTEFGHEIHIERPAPIKNVPASELVYADVPIPEDLVIYKDWLGRLEHAETMLALKLSDNGVVEIPDSEADHLDGTYELFSVGDIAVTKKRVLRNGTWIYGKYSPNVMPAGTVVQVRVISAEVSWLQCRTGGDANVVEPPSVLERNELESDEFHVYDRTKRPLRDQHSNASPLLSNSETDIQLDLRVRFKDLAGACVKYDGSNNNSTLSRVDRTETLGYDLNVFEVSYFTTDVLIQWQDLTVTREHSVDLIPDLTIDDESNVWPGEIAHSLDLQRVPDMPFVKQASKVCVIQRVNAAERMAHVSWCEGACVQYSNDEGEDAEKILVNRQVGIAAGPQEEVSLYDIEAPGELNVRRGDIVLIAEALGRPINDRGLERSWIGEIVDTPLDGTLTVRLGAADPVRDVTLQRENVIVAVRSDGTDAIEWSDADAMSQDVRMNSDGELEAVEGSATDTSEYDTDSESREDEEEEAIYEDENGEMMDADDVENEDWEFEDEEDVDGDSEMPDLISPEEAPPPSNSARPTNQPQPPDEASSSDAPAPYVLLSAPVPTDFAFINRPSPRTNNSAFQKRAAKEHAILSKPSNLPTGVYVRSWESRLDFLRVLIIGPEETPYADAPFVVDFYLPPTFPTAPPEAFFHSWKDRQNLGGSGRVNPNLYEDGKICLSLLGTWESGGRHSSAAWNPAKSTLLQVVVSLLGLVLVREPYFNEAGYEALAGLESSRRASELYSERAFLKSRTFVVAVSEALEDRTGERRLAGLAGLEDVLRWLFRRPDGTGLFARNIGCWEEILRRREVVDAKGEGEETVDENGEGGKEREQGLVMSKGACIMLRKIYDRLRICLDRDE